MKPIWIKSQMQPDEIGWLVRRILNAEDFDHREFGMQAAEWLDELAGRIRAETIDGIDVAGSYEAVCRSTALGVYAIPVQHADGRFWKPRLPSGYDPNLGWSLKNQPTIYGWHTWADAVNALARAIESGELKSP